eukprot:4352109-Amphidinium_carterae.1
MRQLGLFPETCQSIASVLDSKQDTQPEPQDQGDRTLTVTPETVLRSNGEERQGWVDAAWKEVNGLVVEKSALKILNASQ